MIKRIYRLSKELGINPRKFIAIKELPKYYSNLKKARKQLNKKWKIKTLFPCLHDRNNVAGNTKGHYFHQDLLIAQSIFKNKPLKHVDVGSSIYGFVSNVASFREIEIFDIRPLNGNHNNILFKKMDITNFNKDYENYTDSLSCLHALEHFGLGRYGDTIDIYGYKKGFENLAKMLKKDGFFYLSVPIGNQRIEFDAHRVFSIKEIFTLAKENGLKILRFSYVDDKGDLQKDYKLSKEDAEINLNLSFGCGIWEFKKTYTQNIKIANSEVEDE